MKRIEAIIRPEKLHEVTDALIAVGVDDFTVSKVRGSGRQERQKVYYRGVEYTVEFVCRARLAILVSDTLSSDVIETILTTARTGAAGDGMIFVHNEADAIPVCLDDASGTEDASATLPADEHADLPEESVLLSQRIGAVAIATGLVKLLGLAGARWHDLFR
jgi:nitrogen regulatory protein P-II 1